MMTLQCSVLLVCAIIQTTTSSNTLQKRSNTADLIEDGNLDTEQLIRKYKYPAEAHFITTKDNYIVQIHRIANPGGRPCFLQHGIVDSSATYVLMGPNHSLGYFLHNRGYDVWLGNARGNRYSRNHTTLDPDRDEEFWNFSWHEIGLFDIPAVIDYILDFTHFRQLLYVGHSQGSTLFFVLCSMRPNYCAEKIVLMHALGPAAFLKNLRTPFLPYGQSFAKIITNANQEFLPHSSTDLFKSICLRGAHMESVCLSIFFKIVGKNTRQLKKESLAKILGHLPAGISFKQAKHFLQVIESDKFRQYNYGKDNQEIYNQIDPPEYNLTRITVPVALHCGLNDLVTDIIDAERLRKLLPNVVVMNRLKKFPQWTHMDFVYALDAPKMLYNHMEELNKKFFKETL